MNSLTSSLALLLFVYTFAELSTNHCCRFSFSVICAVMHSYTTAWCECLCVYFRHHLCDINMYLCPCAVSGVFVTSVCVCVFVYACVPEAAGVHLSTVCVCMCVAACHSTRLQHSPCTPLHVAVGAECRGMPGDVVRRGLCFMEHTVPSRATAVKVL